MVLLSAQKSKEIRRKEQLEMSWIFIQYLTEKNGIH